MKKGFTLIELLAVIIILAIITIIAVSTLTKIIDKTKKEAIKSSALTYMNAVEDYSVIGELKDSDIVLQSNQKYNCVVNTIIEEKNILPLNEIINIKGYKPSGRNDYLELGSKGEVVSGELNIAGYLVTIKDKEISSIIKGEKVDIESMTLNYTEQTMEKGSTFRIRPIFNPIDTSDQRVTYKSNNTSIIAVSDDGTVTALKNGTAKVTVTSKDNTSIKAECNITVITSASNVTITPNDSEIKVGETMQLTGTIEPGDVTTNSLTWASSNEEIVHVDENGLVTGMSVGNATISATTVNGKTATSAITVFKIDAENITLDITNGSVEVTKTLQLTANITPNNTTDKNVTWTSNDSTIATVSSEGLVTGIKEGNVVITAKTNNNLTATANISIIPICQYTINQQFNYSYTGKVQKLSTKCIGKYKLEVWAAGARGDQTKRGGYSVGILTLSELKDLYIYVGGEGIWMNDSSGWNGGGHGTNAYCTGGGATDIALYGTENSTSWNFSNHFYSRIIVAGGAGAGRWSSYGTGTYGGGLTGGTGGKYSSFTPGTGGSQTSGGTTESPGKNGSFGKGGDTEDAGGGGGGWYGGAGGGFASGGGGGSGYVYTESTASNYPSGCLLNSSYYLTDASTVAGNTSFKSPSGSNETGHSGNGYARITYLGK